MGKHSKTLGILVMSIMVAATLGGCGSTSKSSTVKSIKVAVVLKAINSDYWKQVKVGAVDEGKALGVNVQVVGPNNETDIAGQTTMIEDQITRQPSALILSPSQPAAAASTLNKANAAGIPVILIDTDANWAKKKSFVGTGNEAAGKVGGEFIAKKLKPGDDVVFIRGALGDSAQDQRVDGAKAALLAAGIKVTAIQPADSDRNEALTVMQNLLETHPKVKAVFCTNDEMALGAERALQTSGKKKTLENIKKLGINPPSDTFMVRKLSGGNQQKVVIGKWLNTQANIFIFDEPTRGIDVGAKVEVYNVMNELVSNGAAVIMISSELSEILGMSDRIIVMHEGKVTGEFSIENANQENIMKAASGGV